MRQRYEKKMVRDDEWVTKALHGCKWRAFKTVGITSRLCIISHYWFIWHFWCLSDLLCTLQIKCDTVQDLECVCDPAPKGRLAVKQAQSALPAFHPQQSFQTGSLQMELTKYNVRKQFCCWKQLLCCARKQTKSSHSGARGCALWQARI